MAGVARLLLSLPARPPACMLVCLPPLPPTFADVACMGPGVTPLPPCRLAGRGGPQEPGAHGAPGEWAAAAGEQAGGSRLGAAGGTELQATVHCTHACYAGLYSLLSCVHPIHPIWPLLPPASIHAYTFPTHPCLQCLMALSDDPIVVEETCHTLTLLAEHSPSLADLVVENDAAAIMRLLPQVDERRQLSFLRLLAAIAYSSMQASSRMATDPLLGSLEELVGSGSGSRSSSSSGSGDGGAGEGVRTAALKALGNLAFCADNRRRLELRPQLMQRLAQLSQDGSEPVRVQVRGGG